MDNFMNIGMDAFNDAIANGMDPGEAAQVAGDAAAGAAAGPEEPALSDVWAGSPPPQAIRAVLANTEIRGDLFFIIRGFLVQFRP